MAFLRSIVSNEEDADDTFSGPRNRKSLQRKLWRAGLGAQTVIANLEDVKSYRAFERAVCAGFDPRSVGALERLVVR